MNQASAPTGLEVDTTNEPRREKGTRLNGAWLLIARTVWGALAAVLLLLFVLSLPVYISQLFTVSNGILYVPWQLTPASEETLQSLGISLSLYAPCALALSLLITCTWVTVAGVLFWRKSDDWMALLAALILVWWGTSNISVVFVPADWAWFFLNQASVSTVGNISVYLFFYLFPDGRFVPRWMGWLALLQFLLIASQAFPAFPLNLNVWPEALMTLFVGSLLCSIVGSQIYRYRRVSGPVQRQQTKWVVFAFAVVFSGLFGDVLAVNVLNLPLPDLLVQLLDPVLWHLIPLLIPLSLGFAILRYRLWDIDLIINRTLVYGVLTVSIVTLYILVVVGLGTLLQAQGNLGLSLLATGLVAVLFQPLRSRLQRAVNRLMYGRRDEPYHVLTHLGQRLEASLAPEAVLPAIVETVAQALKLPYAAITLQQQHEETVAASYGSAKEGFVRFPLIYQSEQIGALLLAPRSAGETFTPADHQLLDDLARQAGIAAYSVRLTMDLQRLTTELLHSRTQLVTAREEERRRLRRDLHDGLGSVLAALNWRAGAIRIVLAQNPTAADALVVEQQQTIRAAIADIRRLVYELRPPALDELGLVGAIRERAAQYSRHRALSTEQEGPDGLRVDVRAPDTLLALPAAIEVAVYRIVQEALANVARHAHAHTCCIRLTVEQEQLQLEITDDGIGLGETYHVGIGLLSMRERAEELGGTCGVSSATGGGTCVRVCLPLPKK